MIPPIIHYIFDDSKSDKKLTEEKEQENNNKANELEYKNENKHNNEDIIDEPQNDGNSKENRNTKDEERITLYTKSRRIVKLLQRYGHLQVANQSNIETYASEYTTKFAKIMCQLDDSLWNKTFRPYMAQTYSLMKRIKKIGEKAKDTIKKEKLPLYQRNMFKSMHIISLSNNDKNKAKESVIFLTEKNNKILKARTCASGRIQRGYYSKQDTASLTAINESI